MHKEILKSLKNQEEYRGEHVAPNSEGGSPMHDLGGAYPEDIYTANAVRFYGHGVPYDHESISVIQNTKHSPNKMVKIFRAVPHKKGTEEQIAELEGQKSHIMKKGKLPSGVSTPMSHSDYYEHISNKIDELKNSPKTESTKLSINPKDWVTTSKRYAVDHGEGTLNGKYKILSKTVPAKHLFTDGNSIHEWGYDPHPEKIQKSEKVSISDSSQHQKLKDFLVHEPEQKASKDKIEENGFDLHSLGYDKHLDSHSELHHRVVDDTINSLPKTDVEFEKEPHEDGKQAFHLVPTLEQLQKIKEEGLDGTLNNLIQRDVVSGKPNNGSSIAHLIFEHHPEEDRYHVHEMGSSVHDFHDEELGNIEKGLKEGSLTTLQAHRIFDHLNEKYPKEHLSKLQDILFGDNHPTSIVHDAFEQHLKDNGEGHKKVTISDGEFVGGGYRPHSELVKAEDYKTAAKKGVMLSFPAYINGNHYRPDMEGIHYHTSVRSFSPENNTPDSVFAQAGRVDLKHPHEDTPISFGHLTSRNGDLIHAIFLHGDHEKNMKEYRNKITDNSSVGIGQAMREGEFRPHVSVDKSSWLDLKNKNPKTAKEAGITFGNAEIHKGSEKTHTFDRVGGELHKGEKGDWKSEGYTILKPYGKDLEFSSPGEAKVKMLRPGQRTLAQGEGQAGLACLKFDHKNKTIFPTLLHVDKDHQRKGIMTALLDHAVESSKNLPQNKDKTPYRVTGSHTESDDFKQFKTKYPVEEYNGLIKSETSDRQTTLNKLSLVTEKRKLPCGQIGFLMHRGMDNREYRDNHSGGQAKYNKQVLSWTPDYQKAKDSADKIVSAWIPEKSVLKSEGDKYLIDSEGPFYHAHPGIVKKNMFLKD